MVKTAPKEDKRWYLLEASAKLFREKGFRSTSMQEIAEAVGIQKSSLYHYINTKEDLLHWIATLSTEMLIDGAERVYFSSLGPEKKLRRFIASHVHLVCEHLDLFSVTVRDLIPVNAGGFWKEVVAFRDRYESYLEGILCSGITAGVFRKMDPKMAVLAILGMMNWLTRWYDPKGPLSPARIANLWGDLILKGLKSPVDP